MKKVGDVMTPHVTTVPMTTYISDAKGILVGRRITGAPVIDSTGLIVGLVSLSDIVRFESTGGDAFEAQVYEIATKKLITVRPTDALRDAAKAMLDAKLHRLVVVDNHRVVGMLSALDFVRLFAQES